MRFGNGWSRRQFLAVSGAAAAQAATGFPGLGQATGSAADAAAAQRVNAQGAGPVMPPPGVITGGTQPLMESMTRRPLRYQPVGGEFVIRNGKEYFNRPIYGPPEAGGFRVDAGDLPEFSLYLPGHGGNLKLGLIVDEASKWAANADEVIAKYRPGRMIYEIRDALLGKGMLRAELLTMGVGSGLMVKVRGHDVPAGARLAWAFGGVSGKKGRRGGDIGCEVEPVSRFFEVREDECADTRIIVRGTGGMSFAHVVAKTAEIVVVSPVAAEGASLTFLPADFKAWSAPPNTNAHWDGTESDHPILTGSNAIKDEPLYLWLYRHADGVPEPGGDVAAEFAKRSAQVESLAQSIAIDTPDEYVNAAGPALAVAAEALWDTKQGCLMHGSVAWRQAFAGWRGPYCLDALGTHDRAVANFRHWIGRQNTSPVTTADPATGPWDANSHMTRKEKLLHSNGDVSNAHYDMNLVLFDALLRHLMWTGDLAFAKEVWPALQRHLAWEHRMFRRTYTSASGKELPLYEAYAAIWASDNLQYNGGGAAHSSAYNVFALRTAAKLAKAIGEDGSAYEAEAALIHQGMQELLWVKQQGAFGESKDLFGLQTVYTNPALWTVHHTIDSGVPTARQAWQMAAERLAVLRHVPVHGDGVPEGAWTMLPSSDWLPYTWSLTLLLLGENMHTALALWQTGMREEAFRIFKGSLLDSMYMGLCPGDLHMTSALDVHRQESQRDFGDPTGITSRALVEGLFGVQPDLIAGEVRIRPGFPNEWERASLKHKDFDFAWKREGLHETVEFTSRMAKVVPLTLSLPGRTTSLPVVTCNGNRVECGFDRAAVGAPIVTVKVPAARASKVSVEWHGRAATAAPVQRSYSMGDALVPPGGISLSQIDDPQGCLVRGRIAAAGFHTVFANMHEGDTVWSMPISFEAHAAAPAFAAVPRMAAQVPGEQLNLSSLLKHNVTDIFTRVYSEPRSQFCSMSFPDTLLGGWANPERATIDDAGLRAAGGLLKTAIDVDFATPAGTAPNCLFLSYWKQDDNAAKVVLSGRARGIYLLMAGTTLPQCSRMQHGTVTVTYKDGTSAQLALRNPETWWPIEQDYLFDDYLFVNNAPLPPRVDLRNGQTRILDPVSFHGKGRSVPGGSVTILHLPLDHGKELDTLQVQVDLYGVVLGLLAATLARG